jgi:5-hydroxyisourate hydrolase-like protein (transthyretin family)
MRYLVVLGVTAILAIGWNAWVALHNDGIVGGQVLAPDGRPAAGVTVTFWEKTLTTLEPRATTQTESDGRFLFNGQAAHHFALQAEKRDVGVSSRALYRRYFRGQNLVLAEPLRLGKGP